MIIRRVFIHDNTQTVGRLGERVHHKHMFKFAFTF